MGDLSDYGLSEDTESAEGSQSAEEIRIAREMEWEKQQKTSSILFAEI